MSSRKVNMLLFAAVLVSACGLDLSIAAREGDAQIDVQGIVRDDKTNQPLANALVSLGVFSNTPLAQVRTSADGAYSISYHLKHIVRDSEFASRCYIWDNDVTKQVSVRAEATGYIFNFSDQLRCTSGLQTIHLRLAPF